MATTSVIALNLAKLRWKLAEPKIEPNVSQRTSADLFRLRDTVLSRKRYIKKCDDRSCSHLSEFLLGADVKSIKQVLIELWTRQVTHLITFLITEATMFAFLRSESAGFTMIGTAPLGHAGRP